MKREFIPLVLAVFIILLVGSVSALTVDKTDKGTVVISQLNNPAALDLVITSGTADNIEVFSLVGVRMTPVGSFDIPAGTTTVPVKAYLSKDMIKQPGFFTFEYQIKGMYGLFRDTLTVRVMDLENSISVDGSSLLPGDANATLIIRNVQNALLEDLKIHSTSEFFESVQTITLKPFETKNVSIKLNGEKMKKLNAGTYPVESEIQLGSAKVKDSGEIKYLEKEGLSVKTETTGFLVRKTTTTKTNEGNVPVVARIDMSRDVLTRLFTTYSYEPDSVKRNTLTVDYIWEKKLGPTDTLVVSSTTNYTFPFILLLLVIVIAVFTKIYSKTNVNVTKQVSYVKTQGGEFALKVRLHVNASKFVENVKLSDFIPSSMKLYENYGSIPDRMEGRQMIWNIDRLNAGEERVFSYIVYSKINVVGRFELPPASAVFEREGKVENVDSNRAFFVSDTHISSGF
ncbi:MAG: hypothetical protein WCK90_06020 [archaeon]